MIGPAARLASLAFLMVVSAMPGAAATTGQAGDEYRVTVSYATSSKSSDGGSSSSRGHNTYVERVLEVIADGLELEFDLLSEAKEANRLIEWQWPVRVQEASNGDIRLTNKEEMEARRDAWLTAAEIPREACGSWYFTWNAFQVECDPDAIIPTLQDIRLRPSGFGEGKIYRHPGTLEGASPKVVAADEQGQTLVAVLPIDADFVRKEKAESDVVVAQILGEELTLQEALAARSAEEITGTLTITFETDPLGRIRQRTTLAEIKTVDASGVEEASTNTRTITRELVSATD
jgi:hypothetical protein